MRSGCEGTSYIIVKLEFFLKKNFEECSLIGQVMSLLLRSHQFECHKPHGHWRLI
jgi:hypothetical protein